jgi:hypothetical protein
MASFLPFSLLSIFSEIRLRRVRGEHNGRGGGDGRSLPDGQQHDMAIHRRNVDPIDAAAVLQLVEVLAMRVRIGRRAGRQELAQFIHAFRGIFPQILDGWRSVQFDRHGRSLFPCHSPTLRYATGRKRFRENGYCFQLTDLDAPYALLLFRSSH